MATAAEQLLAVIQAHRQVVDLCAFHGYHVRSCTCGQDPLDFHEHLVNRLLAEGVCTYAAAADRVLDELNAERARLTTEECPEPFRDPMLGNYLGGISAAAGALRSTKDSP
ncbi:MAG TPA: hypothetical protein VNS46_00875 [Nocardioides sp.]|nr:hypothetical protein [Nocardioides sp.]